MGVTPKSVSHFSWASNMATKKGIRERRGVISLLGRGEVSFLPFES